MSQTNIEKSIHSLDQQLPIFARTLISNYLNLSNPLNRYFLNNPDSVDAHSPKWHQWGIITHSRMFTRAIQTELPVFLREWNIDNFVNKELSVQIDGVTKHTLLQAAIVFHDIGKFACRQIRNSEPRTSFSFKDHELLSSQIVRNQHNLLISRYGFSDRQIDYVANCVNFHYTLGKLRDKAKETQHDFTIDFVRRPSTRADLVEIHENHPDYKLEIGIMYLGDSLAKNNIRIRANTDQEIKEQIPFIKETIKQNKLNPFLINSIKQTPVNIFMSRIYLQNIFT